MKNVKYIILVVSFLLMACSGDQAQQGEPGATLFTNLSPLETGVTFINKIVNQKNFNIFKYRNFYNGGVWL